MEISVSSSQRDMNTGPNGRADGPRLEKAPLGDAFSRHLDETRQRDMDARNAAAQDAKQHSNKVRDDRLREERQRDDRRAEARAAEKREAARSRDTAKSEETAQAGNGGENEQAEAAGATDETNGAAETAPPQGAAGETGETGEKSANGPVKDANTAGQDADTAPEKTAVETKATAAPAADGEAGQQTTAGKTADNKTGSPPPQTGAEGTAAKGNVPQQQAAAQAAPQPQTQPQSPNSQQSQTGPQTAAGTAGQPQAGADPEASLSGGSDEGGSPPGGDGKTLGKLAAEKLAAKDGPKDGPADTAKPAAASQDTGARMAAAAQQSASSSAQPGLAGFGLRGTDQPLNVSFDGGDMSTLKLDSVNVGTSAQNSNPVMVRFGALPGQAQATQVPATAIAMQIARHVQKGVNTFEIRIDPPELGRVDVKLEMTDGRVNAHLVVEKPETLDLLQRDSRALQQALRDAGLDVSEDALNFSLSDENGAEGFAGQERGSGGLGQEDTAAQPEQDTVITAQYRLSYTGDSGIDIRV